MLLAMSSFALSFGWLHATPTHIRSKKSFFGLGGGGVKLFISINPPSPDNDQVVKLDHPQKWKAHKNPFHSLKFKPRKKVVPDGGDGGGEHGQQQQQQQSTMVTTAAREDAIYAYEASQDVDGVVTLTMPPGKKAEHLGMKVEFVGRIDTDNMTLDRPHYDFISLSKELEPPCAIYDSCRTYPFHFANVEKIHETYHGKHVSVRYFIRVSMERKFLPPLTKERELIVQKITPPEERVPEGKDDAIKMEVGIEDCLHIEFEYEKRHYHLEDVIRGKVHFLLVRIKIKHMELAVVRRETSGLSGVGSGATSTTGGGSSAVIPGGAAEGAASANALTETQVLIKYEVMDGAPVKGEVIPVRLHLRGIPADLTPTYGGGGNQRFSVRYFLNLVLVDEEDRRYFKQQEIILWRKELG